MTMKREVKKEPKVALCRKCRGTGKTVSGRFIRKAETCQQCERNGRVTVSCEMTLDIRLYKPKGEQVMD